jgi:hypothetical protein
LTPVQDLAYTNLILSRVRAAISPEPATFIARALHDPIRVRDHGADFVQGFLLGKPAPVVRS